MRIGMIYLGRRSGGPPTYEMSIRLAQKADLFALLSENVEGLEVWKQSGLNVLTTPTYLNLRQAAISWLQQARFRRLAALVRAQRPDVLIYQLFHTWHPFLQYYLSDIPSVVAVHDPVPHPDLSGRIFRILEDYSIRHASRCLIFSRGLAGELVKRGVPLERIDPISLGNFDYYTRFDSGPAPRSGGQKTLLFFGRITAYKGLEILLQAFRELGPRQDLRLLIAGDGDMRRYSSLLKSLPQVEIYNRWIPDPEISHYFRLADIVVLPYTSASQSGIITMAAAFGLPVIASRVGGIPEQIEDRQTGLLVDPGSVPQLAKAIKCLLADPQLASRLGSNLRSRYERDFNWDGIADLIYQSCEKALNNPHG